MKRNTLTTAVLAGLTGMAGMVSVSNAVNVNPDGLGQVLLLPYYTARGGNDTLISIVNTTDRGKAVKIRILEALNSREVLDFNIYMSEWDVWTAAITEGSNGGGKIVTADSTCTSPNIFDPAMGRGELPFVNFGYGVAPNADGGPSGLERTLSGHIEFIEMGTFLETPISTPAAGSPGLVPWNAKHVGEPPRPRNCQFFETQWLLPDGIWAGGNTSFGFELVGAAPETTGGLFSSASIINVAEGTMFSYNATALDAFWQNNAGSHTNPASVLPSLASGLNPESNVFVNGVVVTHSWPASILAVNATVTFDQLMNEYSANADVGARTEWVLTFPTKRFHTDAAPGGVGIPPNEPIAPFSNTWHVTSTGALNLACEAMSFRVWDREEQSPSGPTGVVIPSPPPPTPAPDTFDLCRETNVVRFAAGGTTLPAATEITREPLREGAFARLSYTNFGLPSGFRDGWVRFDLANIPAGASVASGASDDIRNDGLRLSPPAANGDQLRGLPVIGFAATTITNGTLPGGTLSNYGGSFNHRGSRRIQ